MATRIELIITLIEEVMNGLPTKENWITTSFLPLLDMAHTYALELQDDLQE